MRRCRQPPCPPALASEKVAKERREVLEHFGRDPQATFDFRAYNHEEVRRELYRAFSRVCAYCEAPMHALAIEHYRPKAAIRMEKGDLRRPGYYWLASTWENLLPSCHECNTDLWNEELEGPRQIKSGKGNWFPVENEADRWSGPAAEKHERPLLLNPYEDEPSEHLDYGEEGVMTATTPRGEATIRIIGLNRFGLPLMRAAFAVQLEAAWIKALKAKQRHRENPGDERLAAEHRQKVEDLKKLLDPAQGFLGMKMRLVERLGADSGAAGLDLGGPYDEQSQGERDGAEQDPTEHEGLRHDGGQTQQVPR